MFLRKELIFQKTKHLYAALLDEKQRACDTLERIRGKNNYDSVDQQNEIIETTDAYPIHHRLINFYIECQFIKTRAEYFEVTKLKDDRNKEFHDGLLKLSRVELNEKLLRDLAKTVENEGDDENIKELKGWLNKFVQYGRNEK